MKQKTKIIFLLLLVTGTLFFSCNLEEEYASEKIHHDNMSVYHKNFNELLKNNKFIKAYSKVLTKKSQVAKTAMEEQYQFTIANNLANVVEGNNEISYTLLIQREVNDPKSFENLVIISDSLNNTSAYIIKYSSINQINTSNFNPSNSEFNKQITPIIYNPTIINESSKEAYYYCYDIMFWVCTYTGHTTTGECTHGHYETVTVCEEVIGTGTGGDATGDSGSSSIDGSSSDGGGGGSATPDSNYNGTDTSIHGNGGTPITTAPVAPEVDMQQPILCQQLKNMNNRTVVLPNGNTQSVLQNLNDLANNISTPRERGYLFEPDSTQTLLIEHYYEGPLNSDEIEMNLGNMAVDIIMHTHYNTNQLSVFSLADLYQIYYSMNVGNIYSPTTFTSILVTAHGTKYALKITDPTAFLNWGNTFFYGWDLALPAGTNNPLIDKSENQYSKFVSNNFSNTLNENGLAKFIENLGVELYSSNSNFSQWSKITPNMNGIPTKTTCP